jgi:hypothetical protein
MIFFSGDDLRILARHVSLIQYLDHVRVELDEIEGRGMV